MSRDPRHPDRVATGHPDRRIPGSAMRASRRRTYSRVPIQSTKALTMKLALFAVVATLAIGGMIAAQMAAGNDPALGPKAVARAKKASKRSATTGSSTGSSAGISSGTDPYTQAYGDDGYSSGSSSGYSSGSSGYSGSSGSTQQYSPPPVTSSTS